MTKPKRSSLTPEQGIVSIRFGEGLKAMGRGERSGR